MVQNVYFYDSPMAASTRFPGTKFFFFLENDNGILFEEGVSREEVGPVGQLDGLPFTVHRPHLAKRGFMDGRGW